MLSDEVASALAPFFDRIGPSHDEISRLIARAGLSDLDPLRTESNQIGKMKRIRGVLFESFSQKPQKGEKLVAALIASVRAGGGFQAGNSNYPGREYVQALQAALKNVGYLMGDDGRVYPMHLESLEGRGMTEALRAYVQRARLGGDDPALVLGTTKSLVEAAARHILKERTGQYPLHSNLPTTLFQVFNVLGLSAPDRSVFEALPPDPRHAMQQAVWLLAIAVNRFRNAEGEGHGRPEVPPTTDAEASVVGLAAGLVTQLLLDSYEGK